MAKGGLIEGLCRCYSEKNSAKKHLFLYLLSLATTIPFLIAKTNTGGTEKEMYSYIIQNPILLIWTILTSCTLAFYVIRFLSNAIKLFIWQDTQKDQERVKALSILPDINLSIYKDCGNVIKFGLVWFFNMIILFVVIGACLALPVINILLIPVAIAILVCYLYSTPYILAGFARNYTLKGNLSLSLIFTLLPKIFVPATILGLKYFVYYICASIAQFFTIFLSTTILKLLGVGFSSYLMVPIVSIAVYIEVISMLIFYYAVANIYYRKIEIEKEI